MFYYYQFNTTSKVPTLKGPPILGAGGSKWPSFTRWCHTLC